MRFTYVAKQYKITEGLKSTIENKLERCDKYISGDKAVNVVMSSLRGKHKIEVTINTRGFIVRAEESHDDMYAAIDLIVDKLERKLRKSKEKMKKKTHNSIRFDMADAIESECICTPDGEEVPSICKRKKMGVKPMSEEEAILQMELLGHDFFIFKDISDVIKILYKRKDDTYGLIESV